MKGLPFHFVPMAACYDAVMADLVRRSLKAHGLDIPGTAYYDEALDHLSAFYDDPRRGYYVLLDEQGTVMGGIGFAEAEGDCCELQKLYLDDAAQGRGLGYRMVSFIEDRAREKGYRIIYLETHSNLQAAIHIYERAGYRRIERPASVVHSTMDHFYLKAL